MGYTVYHTTYTEAVYAQCAVRYFPENNMIICLGGICGGVSCFTHWSFSLIGFLVVIYPVFFLKPANDLS